MITVTIIDPFNHEQVAYLNPAHIITIRQGVDETTIWLDDGSVLRVKETANHVAASVASKGI